MVPNRLVVDYRISPRATHRQSPIQIPNVFSRSPIRQLVRAALVSFEPISCVHLNPPVTLADAWQVRILWAEVPGYVDAQIAVHLSRSRSRI